MREKENKLYKYKDIIIVNNEVLCQSVKTKTIKALMKRMVKSTKSNNKKGINRSKEVTTTKKEELYMIYTTPWYKKKE
jgi:mannose/fructose/N-acetylgalactosamine-specific phosphotransferase system component IIB